MRSPVERALCAREPGLPGLGAVLRAPALARAAGLGRLTQSYLRYKPGTSCIAGLVPPDGGLDAWAAMTYPAARYAEVRQRGSWTKPGSGVRYLDAIQTALVPLGRDRKIPAARRIADPERRAALLAALGLAGCTLHLLRYKPGRRVVLRADDAGTPRALLKLHAKSAFDRAMRGARHDATQGGPVVLGADPGLSCLATAWHDGPSLDADPAPESHAAAGARLAALHAAETPDGVPSDPDADPEAEAEMLAWLCPALSERARSIAAALPAPPVEACVLLHGDFSADQVILGPGGPVIVDWDRIVRGPAERDLGQYLARLDLDAIQGRTSPETGHTLGAALLSGYGPHDRDAVRGSRARALFALVTEGFRQRRRDWPCESAKLLDRIDRLRIPGLDLALSRAEMAPHLASHGLGALRNIRLERHKPGRRALIAYETESGPVLAKLRAKGPDTRTPALHHHLRAAGLDTAPVAVPPVLGEIRDPALWLQPRVAGPTLAQALDAERDGIDGARRAGRALARLHASGVDPGRLWERSDESGVLSTALARAKATLPWEAERLTEIETVATAWLADCPPEEPVCLHRDFYFDQVILGAETTWLIDLDLAARGEPAIDIGNFLAHLTELGLRRDAPERRRPQGAAFLAGYASHRSLPPEETLAALHWISLARHIAISLTFPDRSHTTLPLTAHCHRALATREGLRMPTDLPAV